MGIVSTLSSAIPDLPEGLRRIARFVVADPAAAAGSTIAEMAEASATSPATVNRFCRKFGFSGFVDFKLAIATDHGRALQAGWRRAVGSHVEPGDSLDHIAAILASGDMLAIQQTRDTLDLTQLAGAVTALSAARRVHSFGVSGSFLAADELRHRLQVVGMAAWAWSDVHDGLSRASAMDASDALVAFSHSGRTRETCQVLDAAKEAGATTIAVTNSADGPLSENATFTLLTAVNEGPIFRSQALAARHSQLFICDILFVAVANQDAERSLVAFDRSSRSVETQLVAR